MKHNSVAQHMVKPACISSRHSISLVVAAVSSFLLPLAMLAVVMWHRGLWPFGDRSMLLWDMEIQYVNIYNWYHSVLHGQASLFYDFSKSLGGNMFGVFTTYLVSPINLLTYFFTPDRMPVFITLATVLKICLSGVTCRFYLMYRFPNLSSVTQLILSVCYALCEYNVGLCSNLHFIDILYLLPCMALATYHFVATDKGFPLSLSIGLAIIMNWYVGMMACMGIACYFIFELIAQNPSNIWRTCLRFVGFAIVGGLIGCISLIPTLISTLSGKGGISFQYLMPDFHCSPFEPLKALIPTSQANASYEEPAVYVGGFPVMVVLIRMLDKGVPTRDKFAVAIPLLLVFASFSFVPLEVVWTVLKKAYSFFFRHSFVFSFLLISGSALLTSGAKDHSLSDSLVLLLVACAIAFAYLAHISVIGFISWKFAIAYALVLALYAMCILMGRYSVWIIAASTIVLFIDLGYNTNLAFKRYQIPASHYREYVEAVEGALSTLMATSHPSDNMTFFRLKKTFSEMDERRGITTPVATEGLTFNYNAITHYSSLVDERVNTFLFKTGYIKDGAHCSNFAGPNPLIDSMLGVRYVLTNKDTALLEDVGLFNLDPKTIIHEYYNSQALGLAIGVKGRIDVEWSSDPFQNQEAILKELCGGEAHPLRPLKVEEVSPSNWVVTAKEDGPSYIYYIGQHPEADLYVDGKLTERYFGRFYTNVLYIGNMHAGESKKVKLDERNCKCSHTLLAYSITESEYNSIFESLKRQCVSPDKWNDTYVEFSIDSGVVGNKVLLSIPFDKGWTVRLNGKAITPDVAFDTFIAVEVPNGIHNLELSYTPPGLYLGIGCCLVGLAICAAYTARRAMLDRRHDG